MSCPCEGKTPRAPPAHRPTSLATRVDGNRRTEYSRWTRPELLGAFCCGLHRLGGRPIGRTSDSGSENHGSSPCLPAKFLRQFMLDRRDLCSQSGKTNPGTSRGSEE